MCLATDRNFTKIHPQDSWSQVGVAREHVRERHGDGGRFAARCGASPPLGRWRHRDQRGRSVPQLRVPAERPRDATPALHSRGPVVLI